jgi:hypothetical protein
MFLPPLLQNIKVTGEAHQKTDEGIDAFTNSDCLAVFANTG